MSAHSEDAQLGTDRGDCGECVGIEGKNDHRQHELDNPDGDEALGIHWPMLTTCWPGGGVRVGHCCWIRCLGT